MAPSDSHSVAEKEIIEEQQLREKITNEEYKIWKKSVPLLYDTICTTALEYPSLAVEWLSDYTYSDDKNTIKLRYLYGTNTSEKSTNYLKLGTIDVPSTLAPDFSTVCPNTDSVPIPFPSNDPSSPFVNINSWKLSREINRLRVSPTEDNCVAIDGEGIVHMFNLKTYDQLEFRYHKLQGNAIEWVDNSSFLSGAQDFHIALWDITKPSTPIQLFKSHTGPINDISSSKQHPSLFASVSDDSTTQWHDIRGKSTSNPAISLLNAEVQNSVAIHPDVATLYATAGRDNEVLLFDLRNPSQPFRELYGHSDSVIGLRWDSNPSQLVSWAVDKRAIVWDMERLDTEYAYPNDEPVSKRGKQSQQNKVDPCLKFIHAGHTNRINCVGVHPKVANVYASVGEDNLLEVWKPKTLGEKQSDEE